MLVVRHAKFKRLHAIIREQVNSDADERTPQIGWLTS